MISHGVHGCARLALTMTQNASTRASVGASTDGGVIGIVRHGVGYLTKTGLPLTDTLLDETPDLFLND